MWQSLLAKIANDDVSGLILSLDNGSEVSVQQILALDDTTLVVRGRWAGSSESGWTFIIPLGRIVCLGFAREVPASLGNLFPAPSVRSQDSPTAATSSSSELPQPSAPDTAHPQSPPESAISSATTPPAADTGLAQRLQELRQRLRQRLGQNPPRS